MTADLDTPGAETDGGRDAHAEAQLRDFLQHFLPRLAASGPPAAARRATLPPPLPRATGGEAAAPSSAAGLRMAVNDGLEACGLWPLAKVSALDAEFRARGVLTLSQVRQRAWGRYAAVLKRAQVRNEVEYLLVRGVLADPAQHDSLPAAERGLLQAAAAAYDAQRPPPRPPRARPGPPARPGRWPR